MEAIQVKERPILFSGPMIQALLAGTKTQTRRIVKVKGDLVASDLKLIRMQDGYPDGARPVFEYDREDNSFSVSCPYGQPGERLWVRETSRAVELTNGIDGICYLADNQFRPIDDSQEAMEQWLGMYHYRKQKGAVVPTIHMPRWASRILLEIVSVRVERLHDISREDALVEGVWRPTLGLVHVPDYSPVQQFKELWTAINGHESTDSNPWVWVVEFKVLTPNVA